MSERVEELIASYPRTRPPLPASYRAIYTEHYRWNRAGKQGLAAAVRRLESWMHRCIAEGAAPGSVLELGAGNLNHLPYESRPASYDVVEPFQALLDDSPHRRPVGQVYGSISEVPDARRYDRVLSVAVLEHLTDLPWVLARCGLMLAHGGRFQAAIPSEGALLWGLAWRCTTAIAFRLRHGLAYSVLVRHEHVNTAAEVTRLCEYFFSDVKLRRFPLPMLHLSFYTAIEAAAPRLDRCAAFCRSRPLAEG